MESAAMDEVALLSTLAMGVLLIVIGYFITDKIQGAKKDPYPSFYHDSVQRDTRNIIKHMEVTGKNCAIFYGSQTGTAEDYAYRLAKEGKSRFGLETIVADLADYDYDNLEAFPATKVAIFVLATYGDGEPTDNARDFYELISSEASFPSQSLPLSNLRYAAFGLGNSTYEHYNDMIRNIDSVLQYHGAQRIGNVGEGDDGKGTIEDEFIAWKEPMWAVLAKKMGLEGHEATFDLLFRVSPIDYLTRDSEEVYLGERNEIRLDGIKGPFNAKNPYLAPVVESWELFNRPIQGRRCVHMEINIRGSDLSYQTGDHIAIWPSNPDEEVNQFLEIFDLTGRRHQIVSVEALDSTSKVPVPSPTTYDAIARYYLEICAPVSRQFLATLARFSPDETARTAMVKLASDKDYFRKSVSSPHLNIVRALASVSQGQKWTSIPFPVIIEGLNRLQPRYYSISSSSIVQPLQVSITAVVETKAVTGREDPFRGVASNYLLALMKEQSKGLDSMPNELPLKYEIGGPRNQYNGTHLLAHLRRSDFKLPLDQSKPIILVGPGTGVAPFRAFVQERAYMARKGEDVGETVLFFGCRKRDEDFLYEKEWEQYKTAMGDKFKIVLAFSREGLNKVYVQHRLKEHGEYVNELMEKKQANVYVCGEAANMAREVKATLIQIIATQRGVGSSKAERILNIMRLANQYQEDVW
ncbi:FAD binding domain-containing protein [Ilyonectria destructans]|nr:FAD binding domain-containing protein [Ilyonectria destructans]